MWNGTLKEIRTLLFSIVLTKQPTFLWVEDYLFFVLPPPTNINRVTQQVQKELHNNVNRITIHIYIHDYIERLLLVSLCKRTSTSLFTIISIYWSSLFSARTKPRNIILIKTLIIKLVSDKPKSVKYEFSFFLFTLTRLIKRRKWLG